MQAESDEQNLEPESVDLALLADRLVLKGMPVQRVIGEEAGVSQSTVSRAIHGKIRTQSAGATRLWRYAEERVRILSESPGSEVRQAAASKLDRPVGRRAPRRSRLAAQVPSQLPMSEQERQSLARRALRGLRDYLEDRFDPQLVIEQLAVLRRAQDHGRAAQAAVPRPAGSK